MQAFDGRDVANTGNGKWSKAIPYPQTWRWGKVHRAGNVKRQLAYERRLYSTVLGTSMAYPPNECNDPLAGFKSNVPVEPTNHLPAW